MWCRFVPVVLLVASLTPHALAQRDPVGNKQIGGVPFVGCKSDGQVGPLEAPKRQTKAVVVSADVAQDLAYYKAEQGPGILAPRGWNCYGTYGSSGSTLYVAPGRIDPRNLFSTEWKGFSGAAIQASLLSGDTSGRFAVAKVIARLFPQHADFVRRVVAEGMSSAGSYPSGPYPADRLTRIADDVVEFETPGNQEGLGTQSRLRKNPQPISGVEILIPPTPDLVTVAMRLPTKMERLAPAIIAQAKHDAAELAKRE